RLQEEAVRTGGEVLEGGRREGPRPELMIRERLAGERVRVDEPVGRSPAPEPAPAAGAERAAEVDVRVEAVARAAVGGRRVGVAEPGEQREVVLRLVDRVRGTLRGGPAEPAAGPVPAARLELVEPRQPSRRRAQRLEPVERRHPRPRLLDVDARPREDDALAGRAHGEPECESLRADPGGLRGERGDVESAAVPVEEDRILDDLPREELLGEAGDEDDVEGEAA